MNQIVSKLSLHTLLVFFVISVGILLRFWHPGELAFINDELSAWQRISYGTLAEVIQNVQETDVHPAGTYIFLYYWTAIFGTSELAIKLPFALMAVGSLFLLYSIGKQWFNKNVALLTLVYFATLQHSIWWAAIARPYQSGLFLGLLLVWFWTQLVIHQKNNFYHWVGFILAGSLGMYNHYFSFIFAGTVGLGGFWWVEKKQLKKYIGAGIVMFILFIPHIPITYHHLTSVKMWYPAPESSFLIHYLGYIFHYSFWCIGGLVSLFIGSIFLNPKGIGRDWKKRLTAMWFFLFPLFFGYFYSIYQSPIIRESHLVFSFPYLVLFLLSFFGNEMKILPKVTLVIIALSINIYTLVVTRQHYTTMNSHPYKPFVVHTKALLEQTERDNVHIVLGENPLYLEYYKTALGATFEHVESFQPVLSIQNFRQMISDTTKEFLIVGSLPETYIQMGMDYYPHLIQQEIGINFEYYILKRSSWTKIADSTIAYTYQSSLSFNEEQAIPNWSIDKNRIGIDTATINFYYTLPEGEEWGANFEAPINDIIHTKHTFVEMSMKVRTDSLPANGKIVFEVKDSVGNMLAWMGTPIVEQITAEPGQWQTIYASIRVAHWLPDYETIPNATIKAFYWNENKQAIGVDDMKMQVRAGNPILYKDTNPF